MACAFHPGASITMTASEAKSKNIHTHKGVHPCMIAKCDHGLQDVYVFKHKAWACKHATVHNCLDQTQGESISLGPLSQDGTVSEPHINQDSKRAIRVHRRHLSHPPATSSFMERCISSANLGPPSCISSAFASILLTSSTASWLSSVSPIIRLAIASAN